MRFVFRIITLPALLTILLIIPFRVPGSIDQVLLAPVIMTFSGIFWMQAGAWRVPSARITGVTLTRHSMTWPLAALLVQLLVFQLILRPGIDFQVSP